VPLVDRWGGASAERETEPVDGAAAPSSPIYQATGTVTATIGGVNAPVLFAGLTPTFAGLYQIR
jgi:uncharacterized protein (TIGR03437 family)